MFVSNAAACGLCPGDFIGGTPVGDGCYWVHDFGSVTDWDTAELECHQRGGSLIVLATAEQQTDVITALGLSSSR